MWQRGLALRRRKNGVVPRARVTVCKPSASLKEESQEAAPDIHPSRVLRAATDPTAASRVTASVRLQRERGRHHARGLLSIVTVVAWVISA